MTRSRLIISVLTLSAAVSVAAAGCHKRVPTAGRGWSCCLPVVRRVRPRRRSAVSRAPAVDGRFSPGRERARALWTQVAG